MPTYEFRCPNGHVFDKFYRSFADSLTEIPCTECGETASRQISGGAGLVFKGSGFYLTDYGKNAHRKGGDSKAGESKGGESKSESKGGESKGGESKPAGGESKSSGGSDAASKPASSGGDKA
jgi:putative FmdB family regulatory protein